MLFYEFAVFGLLCQFLETLQDAPQSEMKESCSDEYFNVSCASRGGGGDVILMESAKYGRMRVSRCVSTNIGCSIDALEFIEGQCSGRRQCSVYVSDINLQRMAPCSKEFTSYLETKHICLNVATGSKSSCQRDRQILLSGKEIGYIASVTSMEPGGYGTSSCPWKIETDPGQTIRLSLLSFGSRGLADGDGPRTAGSDACYEVGEVREKGGALGGTTIGERPTAFSMCSDNGRTGERESVFFVSTGSDVTIQMKPPEVLKGLAPFIVKYEVRGCRQLRAPTGGYVKFEGYTATVHCNHTKETWFLTCTGSTWLGQVGNCTKGSSVIPGSGVASLVEDNFPYGILLVVAIGVALGVLIGGVLLSCVAYYMKRHTRLHGYSEPSEWTKQMLDEMEAYNEAKQLTNNTRYIPDGQHATTSSTPVAATTIVSAAATPSRTMDRTLDFTTSLAHVRGCTCPRDDDDEGGYPVNNDCHLVLAPGGACNATSHNQSRFLYEIPQFNN